MRLRQYGDGRDSVGCECVVVARDNSRAHGLGGANEQLFEPKAIIEQW